MNDYVLATNKSWNIEAFMSWRDTLDGNWKVCVTPKDLSFVGVEHSPRFIFFPHWSHIVPNSFLESHECVCFHMTDVPFGRGGSPLQNLIVRGHEETVLSALRMTPELDAGPVYLKRPLSLDGNAEEIFRRAAELSMAMIRDITQTEPEPSPQEDNPVFFKRRKPAQSKLPETGDLQRIYDHIRMLDAPGYPRAFIEHGNLIATVTDASFEDDVVEARVRFHQPKRADN